MNTVGFMTLSGAFRGHALYMSPKIFGTVSACWQTGLQGILVVHKTNHMPQRELHEMETRERGCTPHTAASPNLPEALSPLVKSRKFQKRHLLAIMCSRVPRAPKRTTPMAHAHAEPVLFLCCGNTCLATSNIEQNNAGQRTHKQFRYSSSSHRARCWESTDVH